MIDGLKHAVAAGAAAVASVWGGVWYHARPAHPQPGAAVAEAHARAFAWTGAPAPPCTGAAALEKVEAEIPFGDSDRAITETGQRQLEAVTHWAGCHLGAPVAILVVTEHHYRRPEFEQDLIAGRRQTVVDYLQAAGLGSERLRFLPETDAPPPVPQGSARLVLRGRGW